MALDDMYGPISKINQRLFWTNKKHIVMMRDVAIKKLVEITIDSKIILIQDLCECLTYKQAYNCSNGLLNKLVTKIK